MSRRAPSRGGQPPGAPPSAPAPGGPAGTRPAQTRPSRAGAAARSPGERDSQAQPRLRGARPSPTRPRRTQSPPERPRGAQAIPQPSTNAHTIPQPSTNAHTIPQPSTNAHATPRDRTAAGGPSVAALEALCRGFAQLYLEVECGRRSRSQLRPLMTLPLYLQLSEIWITGGELGKVVRVHGQLLSDRRYEAVAIVRRGRRTGALAIRLRRTSAGWQVEEAVRPEDGPLPPPPDAPADSATELQLHDSGRNHEQEARLSY